MQILTNSSREEWVEQRRHRVTATDVARLASSAAAWEAIRDEKAGSQKQLRMSPEMEWGILRETALILRVRDLDSSIGHNEYLVVDGDWAATPDGIGYTSVAECKTGAMRELVRNRKKHIDQCQWQMLVCHKYTCYLAWEERVDTESGFSVGASGIEIVERDEDRINELKEVATRFMEGDYPTDLDAAIGDFLAQKATADKELARQNELADELRAQIGDRDFTHAGAFGKLTYSQSSKVNVKRLLDDHPELADQYRPAGIDVKRLEADNPALVSEYREPAGRRLRVTEPKAVS